jgi:hypothetical protein
MLRAILTGTRGITDKFAREDLVCDWRALARNPLNVYSQPAIRY